MIVDMPNQIGAIQREVGTQESDGGELVAVVLRRTYPAAIEDVWDALTDPDRVKRWFMPLHGDLRVGGTFQLEGNAGGDILECEPPRRVKVTFGGPSSLVELRLTGDDDDETVLELEHTVPIEMAGSTAGALYVGPGWDGAFLALDLFFQGEIADDPVAAANSREGLEFSKQSIDAWVTTVETSGTATADEIAAATAAARAQFTPDTGADD